MPAVHIHLYKKPAKDARGLPMEKTYAELQRMLKSGSYEASSDLRKSGTTWGTQEVRETNGMRRVLTVHVEQIPDGVGDTTRDEGYKHNWETTTKLSEMRTALREWERAIEKEPKGDPHNGRLYRLRQELQSLKRRMARMEANPEKYNGKVKGWDAAGFTAGQLVNVPQLAEYVDGKLKVTKFNPKAPEYVYVVGKVKAGNESNEPNGMNSWRIPVSWVADASNHMGEKEYTNFNAWKTACRSANKAVRFEGDIDICNALPGVGEWDGEKGVVYAQRTGDGLPLSPRRHAEAEARFKERTKNMTPAQLAKEKADWGKEIERSRLAEQKGEDARTGDTGLTEWIRFPTATYEKLEVGKNYKSGGKGFKVLEKSLGDGSKSAAGIGNGTPLVKVKWKDNADLTDAYFRNLGVDAKKDGESEAQLRIALRVLKATPAQVSIALATYARARTGSLVMSDVSASELKAAIKRHDDPNREDPNTVTKERYDRLQIGQSMSFGSGTPGVIARKSKEPDGTYKVWVKRAGTKDMAVPSYVIERVAKMTAKPTPEQVQAFSKTLKWPTPELTAAWVATRPTKDAVTNYRGWEITSGLVGEEFWVKKVGSKSAGIGSRAGPFDTLAQAKTFIDRSGNTDDAGKFDENKHKREGGKFASGGGGGSKPLPEGVKKVSFGKPNAASKARLEKEAPKNAEGKRVLTPSAVAALKKRFGGGKYD